MNSYINKSLLVTLISISFLGCQNQHVAHINSNDNQPTLNDKTPSTSLTIINLKHSPCKLSSTPLIKDKSKIKAMLFKEGVLTSDMSENEVNKYVTAFIKRKSSAPCKPTVKNTSNLHKSEK